jgi:dTDP-glucose 4,6-dehydratase
VYGTARRVPISEGHPLQAQSPYSASKIGADKLAESFYCSYDLPVVTLRPFNTYGPRQSSRAVIPTIITQALTGPVVRLGNLEAIRDLTYVGDTVRGFLAAAVAEGAEGGTYNLGTAARSVSATWRTDPGFVRRMSGWKSIRERRPTKSEVMRLVSDNRLALDPRMVAAGEPDEGLQQTIIGTSLERYRVGVYEV